MIVDVPRFVAAERDTWKELETILERIEADPSRRLSVVDLRRFHYLYQKTSADLARISTFAFEPRICRYLESLVARAYGEVHETRETKRSTGLGTLFWYGFPAAFQRRIAAFWLAVAIMMAGTVFGGVVLRVDPTTKPILLPFSHLQGDPAERVAHEEKAKRSSAAGSQSSFSAFLMTHNIRVSIFTFSSGIAAGLGTIVLLFYNGVILGAITVDYVFAGQTRFLLGWLLPHGVIEIPAILIAGQAGLLLGGAIVGWKDRASFRQRLRNVAPDLVVLLFGLAVLLVWAGVIEASFSQWHEPVMPYGLKIGFGLVELTLLVLFLSKRGVRQS
ncbi:MAG TPA: stage II sporulation protein M [Chthoniobacterales bacterium]|nr:stage II sporulation protein M [Chthoniobacterales bacterium]